MPGKVLIVSYYWPPDISAGAWRWYHFATHLKNQGYEPIIVTMSGSSPPKDSSFRTGEFQMISIADWDPYVAYNRISGRKFALHRGLMDHRGVGLWNRFILWTRANLFIPDAKVYGIYPAFYRLRSVIVENEIRLMISTGPPQSMHLLAWMIKRTFTSLRWIADFRDLWLHNEQMEVLPHLKISRRKIVRQEKKVLRKVDQVLTVSPSWSQYLQTRTKSTVSTIFSGYRQSKNRPSQANVFSIGYFGYLSMDRNPEYLWDVLEEMSIEPDGALFGKTSISFYGAVDPVLKLELQSRPLNRYIHFMGEVPYPEVQEAMSRMSLLVFTQSRSTLMNGHIPMKCYDYLASGSQILGIGKTDSDCSRMLIDLGYRGIIDFNNKDAILNRVILNYQEFLMEILPVFRECKRYSIEANAVQLERIIESELDGFSGE